jgi:uncharacterized protein (DUF983 family)
VTSLLTQIRHPRCPRCAKGRLFKDWLSIVDECGDCGLVLKHHDAADGPTFFALVVVGFLIIGLVGVVEYQFAPPLWVHAALWIPLTFLLSIACLRAFKAIFITVEFRLALLKEQDPHA